VIKMCIRTVSIYR